MSSVLERGGEVKKTAAIRRRDKNDGEEGRGEGGRQVAGISRVQNVGWRRNPDIWYINAHGSICHHADITQQGQHPLLTREYQNVMQR